MKNAEESSKEQEFVADATVRSALRAAGGIARARAMAVFKELPERKKDMFGMTPSELMKDLQPVIEKFCDSATAEVCDELMSLAKVLERCAVADHPIAELSAMLERVLTKT